MGPHGMVTCPHSLASQAGVDVLRAGGSAVDAAIATSAALAVLYPHMTGVGGDAFWLVHDAKTGQVRYLDGGGRAAASASIDWFKTRGHDEIPFRGVLPATLTTPGSVASWGAAHAAYGRLPLSRCLESAIVYARDGFPVTQRLAGWIEHVKKDLAPHAESCAIFMPDGQVPVAGSKLTNPNLANTLEAIAAHGPAGFYEGA
ncbi:MAG: gamma-glutamyltransferase, partial [Betaproteobacteria bacterium]|nr:gamma-glutamyltransferase [Betaproteobacteria bacterium]